MSEMGLLTNELMGVKEKLVKFAEELEWEAETEKMWFPTLAKRLGEIAERIRALALELENIAWGARCPNCGAWAPRERIYRRLLDGTVAVQWDGHHCPNCGEYFRL